MLLGLGNPEQFLYFGFVKAHYDVIVNANYWDTHLSGHLNHVLPLLSVGGDIHVSELHVMFVHEVLGSMTEVTGWGAVNGNRFVHTYVLNV